MPIELDAAADLVRKRLKRDTQAARSTVVLPLPIADGEWLGKFGVLDPEAIDALDREFLSMNGASSGADIWAGMIADSLRCLCTYDGKGEVQEVHVEGRPLKFGLPFAEAVGIQCDGETQVVDVVKAVWTLDDDTLNIAAMDRFAGRLRAFMQDTTQAVRGEIVGESRGGRPSGEQAEPPLTE